MKKFKNIFLYSLVVAGLASCESDEERYSGTPVGNQEIITIDAVISSPISSALTNQDVPFTVTLVNKTFTDTVTVEVTTLNKGGGRTRVSVDIMPNQSTTPVDKVHEIPAAGGAIFSSSFEMFVSGIALKRTEPGKHYLINSNVLTFGTGSTSIPSDDSSKLQLRFAWFNPSLSRNDFRFFVDRPNVSSYNSAPGATNAGATITVSDTSGLMPGMAVQVSSGNGAFPANAVVTAVTSATTFTVSQAPTQPPFPDNRLGNNAVVTAGGNDYNATGASMAPGSNNLINVTSTAGLVPGMTLFVTSGTGKFKPLTTVAEIISPTQFKTSLSLTAPGVLLSDATITAAYPDVLATTGGNAIDHGILINATQNSLGNSTPEGDYYFKFIPRSVISSGADIPYRIVWKRPNGAVESYEGVYNGATLESLSKAVLKVNKSGSGASAAFTITPL